MINNSKNNYNNEDDTTTNEIVFLIYSIQLISCTFIFINYIFMSRKTELNYRVYKSKNLAISQYLFKRQRCNSTAAI